MKKLFLIACACLLAACSSAASLTGTAESAKNESGDYTTATVVVKGDKIESVSLDVITEAGSKKELKDDYNMKGASGIGKEWYEQAEFLENYLKENGIDSVNLTAEGYAADEDVLAGCTINIKELVETAQEAYNNAK